MIIMNNVNNKRPGRSESAGKKNHARAKLEKFGPREASGTQQPNSSNNLNAYIKLNSLLIHLRK